MKPKETKDYFYRVFVKRPIEKDRALSSLSYRLAGFLIEKLDFYKPRKLPQRKNMAETLGVSIQAILDSLAQLENVGFMIRTALPARIIYGDEEKQNKINYFYTKKFKEDLKDKRFNDEFVLNFNYNFTKKEYLYSIYINVIQITFIEQVSAYKYIFNLEDSDFKKKALNSIISSIVYMNGWEYVFQPSDYEEVFCIVEDILKNSELMRNPFDNNIVTSFIININEENLALNNEKSF